ncbi:MAG TPA: hypothetical protein VNF07_03885 [Acidimicrobiales bacterium]|nr:hypothetical protein [Acidimicrobiales bacterium]
MDGEAAVDRPLPIAGPELGVLRIALHAVEMTAEDGGLKFGLTSVSSLSNPNDARVHTLSD